MFHGLLAIPEYDLGFPLEVFLCVASQPSRKFSGLVKSVSNKSRQLRVGMISLGCAKNLVDAEIMIGSLVQAGMEITNDPAGADVLIVNTCSFIETAQQESVDTILESAELREAQNKGQALIVAGCLPQRFREELPKLLPEVDAFMGIDQVSSAPHLVREAFRRRAEQKERPQLKAPKPKSAGRPEKLKRELALPGAEQPGAPVQGGSPGPGPIVDVHSRPRFIPDFATPRFRLTPRHFAYLKIAEGCNHPCSFCIIPRMRGSHRSRAQQDIVSEARHLLSDGVKEINVISQDSTYYGLDLRPSRTGSISSPEKFTAATRELAGSTPTLSTLLRELNELPGDYWIRLLYTHPAHWTDELIETIAQCRKVARYVDMPLQHIHHNMLERMRRETSQDYIVDLIKRIRKGIPGIALRTTFIVGFPGETEACFDTLLQFIREVKFERMGVFTYSHEDGTRAAGMSGQIGDEVKLERRDRAMAAQLAIAQQLSKACLGRRIKVLVEKQTSSAELKDVHVRSWEHGLVRAEHHPALQLKGTYCTARGEADAPDIDGRVYVRGPLPAGQFATVQVTGHSDYDLIAEPVARQPLVEE